MRVELCFTRQRSVLRTTQLNFGRRLARGLTISISLFIFGPPYILAGDILIYGPSLNPLVLQNESFLALRAGHTVTVLNEATWSSFTTEQFASFDAIVFGDLGCITTTSLLATAEANKAVWSAAITGPKIIIGTDPVFHRLQGDAQLLMTRGINYAASGPGTGLYVSLSCYFINASSSTSVDFLSLVGNFQVLGLQAECPQSATILQPEHPAMAGLTEAGLSGWGCSMHEWFTSFPTSFTALVAETSGTPSSRPYIIAAPATLSGEFTINVTSFIPGNHTIGPPQSRCEFTQQLFFDGDDRSFDPMAVSFRSRQLAILIPDQQADADGLKEGSVQHIPGESRSYAPDALANAMIDPADDDAILDDCHLLHDVGTASNEDMILLVTRMGEKRVQARFFGGVGNPLVFGSWDIDWDFTIVLDASGATPIWTLSGEHDGFPAFEVYINNLPIYTRDPGPPPYTFTNHLRRLFPPLDVPVVPRSGELP